MLRRRKGSLCRTFRATQSWNFLIRLTLGKDTLEIYKINDEVNNELIDMIKMGVELLESLNATTPIQKEEDSSWNEII
jgi:hypothetical protein